MLSELGACVSRISGSKRRIAVAVAITTICFGLFGFLVERGMEEWSLPSDLHAAVQASIVGIGAGLGAALFLMAVRERRVALMGELERVAELNHTVRNSLEVIVLAHNIKPEVDEAHRTLVLESTKKIETKLRELFPVVGIERRRTIRQVDQSRR